MRLKSIELPGFGCLRDFRADLGAGLNLFYGDNEAGKSTLQQAICAMLYGFHDGERATAAENARHRRYRPWSGLMYRGVLTYDLEDGRGYEVRRDFSTADVSTQLLDSLGFDAAAEFGRGRHGQIPFARKQLGMPRSVFESCAFISQGEIFELSKNAPTEIGDAIAALADSSRRDVSARRAIEKLEAATKRIGRDSARTAELPVARDNLRQKRVELTAADAARAAVAGQAQRLDELQAKRAQLAAQVQRLELACHQEEAVRLRDDLRKLDAAEASLADAIARRDALLGYANVLTVMRDEVISLRAGIKRSSESLVRLCEERETLAESLTEGMRLEYEALQVSVGELSEEQVRSLEAVARGAARAGALIHKGGALIHKSGLWAAVGRVLRAVGRAIASLVRKMLRRSPSATPVGAASGPDGRAPTTLPVVSADEAQALIEKHRRFLTLRPLIDKATGLAKRIDEEEASVGANETQLRALLRTAGIEMASLSAGVEAYADACGKREAYEKAAASAQAAEDRCGAVLAGRRRDEMAVALAEAEARCDAAAGAQQAAQPGERPLPNGVARRDELRRQLQRARDDLHRGELDAEGLETEVRVALERFRPRAEIEEEVAHWEREVARLERARAALTLARETIGEAMTAVYRDFAPAVNSFLSDGIEAATDGRYTRAHVDPATLRISLLLPETGEVLQDPPVSHGTRTLLYVLMRIGLAQHMSAIGEPVPLVLDDPFVDVDSRRLRRMLDYLLKLTDRTQVLLFTKDAEILSWFEENAADGPHRAYVMSDALSPSVL